MISKKIMTESNKGRAVKYTARPLKLITKDEETELLNIWHLSKVLHNKRHDRLMYTTKSFIEKHKKYTQTGVYKQLTRLLEGI